MTFWEFGCAVDGYNESQGRKPPGRGDMSEDRLSELGIEGF